MLSALGLGQAKKPQCQTCKKRKTNLRRLDCGHVSCTMCCTSNHNAFTIGESRTHPGQTLSRLLPCQICSEMTVLDDGVEGLVRSDRNRTNGVVTLQLGPALVHNGRDSLRRQPGQQDQNSSKLLWHHTGNLIIRDLAFLSDGSVVFITQGKKEVSDQASWMFEYTELAVVDKAGQQGILPFPAAFTRPLRLASSIDGRTLAVTDWRGDTRSIIILRHQDGLWVGQDHPTSKPINSIAIMSSSDVVCSAGYNTILRYRTGNLKWSKSLPGSGMMFLPYLAMFVSGEIVASNPNNNEVVVINSKGKIQCSFPTRFIKWPMGVCVNSHGNVLVADQATDTISMFTMGGVFVREVVQLDVQPLDIDIFEDRYLAVSTGDNGLLMYDLKPDEL